MSYTAWLTTSENFAKINLNLFKLMGHDSVLTFRQIRESVLYTVKNDLGETNAHVRWRTYPSLIVWISMFNFKKGFASLPARMRIKKPMFIIA
jgi:hypothetical protein